jgi:hypothetical protein
MNKKFSYILISLCMLGILLAPITPVLQINSEGSIVAGVATNKVEAQATAGIQNQASLDAYLRSCGTGLDAGSPVGCLIQILYALLVTLPTWFLGVGAKFFNYMAALTLSDTMYRADFISKIWHIVRDFANIFFILILLYAAFQVILGLGGGGGKKMVASVLLIALLVNFSLFFSKIVIDASNVTALIFYNKIECLQVNPKGGPTIPCDSPTISDRNKTNVTEKDVTSAIISTFDINNFFDAEFFKGLEDDVKNWKNANRVGTQATIGTGTLDNGLALALIVTFGVVIYPLAWSLIVVALSFLGRMITLMMLLVISPIAFVTAAVPKFRTVNTIGFSSWLEQLLKSSFMATIFMAILYLVYEIMNADIFKQTQNIANHDVIAKILLIFIPAVLVTILLHKGAKYAEKASGEITGMIMKGAKVGGLLVGGAALSTAAGGAARLGQATIGNWSSQIANSTWAKKWATMKGPLGTIGSKFHGLAEKGAANNYDIRKGVVGAGLDAVRGITGVDLRKSHYGDMFTTTGGFEGDKKRAIEKRQKIAESLKVGEDEAMTQDLRKEEADHQELMGKTFTHTAEDGTTKDYRYADYITKLEKDKKDAEEERRDRHDEFVAAPEGAEKERRRELYDKANKKVANTTGELKAFKRADTFITSDGGVIDHRDKTLTGLSHIDAEKNFKEKMDKIKEDSTATGLNLTTLTEAQGEAIKAVNEEFKAEVKKEVEGLAKIKDSTEKKAKQDEGIADTRAQEALKKVGVAEQALTQLNLDAESGKIGFNESGAKRKEIEATRKAAQDEVDAAGKAKQDAIDAHSQATTQFNLEKGKVETKAGKTRDSASERVKESYKVRIEKASKDHNEMNIKLNSMTTITAAERAAGRTKTREEEMLEKFAADEAVIARDPSKRGTSIKQFEVERIPEAKHAIEKANHERMTTLTTRWGKEFMPWGWNALKGLGRNTLNTAIHKVKMGVKLDSKGSGGGGVH